MLDATEAVNTGDMIDIVTVTISPAQSQRSTKCLFDQIRSVVMVPFQTQALANGLRLLVKGDNSDIVVILDKAFDSSLDSRDRHSLK